MKSLVSKAAITLAAAAAALGIVAATAAPSLDPGWNLIAGTNETTAQFSHEHSCVTAIWGYANYGSITFWRAYFPNGLGVPGAQTLSIMPSSHGFWVYCANA